jgi:hypothetical protein
VNVSSRCINPTIKFSNALGIKKIRISRVKRRVICSGYWKGETSESRTPRMDLVQNKTKGMIAEENIKRLRKPEDVANSSEANLRDSRCNHLKTS